MKIDSTRSSLRERLLGVSCSSMLRMLGASWRVETQGMEILDRLVATNQQHVIAFWHRKYVTLFPLLQSRPATVVTSFSSRGNVIRNICRSVGLQAIQIPDEGNGHLGRELLKGDSKCVELGIAVDGPLGPDHRVKQGIVRLSAKLGSTLVPVSVAARRKFIVTRRWDRLEIPYLFTRVALVVGVPIAVPRDVAGIRVSEWATELENAINSVDAAAESLLAGHRKKQ